MFPIPTIKLGAIAAGVAGLAIAAWLVRAAGVGAVAATFAHAGFGGVVSVVLFHLLQLVCSALGWRAIAVPSGDTVARAPREGLAVFALVRFIREGVNNLLPVAQIGGEVVAARLLCRRGDSAVAASAGLVCDLTLETLTEAVFVAGGVALLTATVGRGAVGPALLGTLAFCVGGAGALVAALRFGAVGVLERLLIRLSARFAWPGAASLAGLDAAIRRAWRRPGPVGAGAWWHGLSWLLGGPEVMLGLHVLTGHAPSLAACLAIESIGQATKSVGFAVPGAIGVQEGGLVLVCGFYGIPADTAVALSLLKRVREIVLGAPALLAWQWLDGRRATNTEAAFGTGTAGR